MKTSWSAIAREQAATAHKSEVDSLKAKIAQYQHTVSDLEQQLGIALSLGKSKIRPRPLEVSMTDKAEAVAVAMASDWHVEETVESSSVNGLNQYNLNIAKQRIEKFFSTICRLTEIERHGAKIDDLILWLGGDLMTGMIHEELAETNSRTPTQVILWLQDRLADGLATLKPHFKRILIPTSYGNHGRCHDETTELLTRDGWKTYKEIEVGDDVATYNMKNGATEWQPLEDVYVADYSGPMVSVKTRSADFMVTPHHRMVVRSHSGEDKFMEMEVFVNSGTFGSHNWPKCALGSNKEHDGVTDDELILLGWVVTDGSYGRQKGKISVRLHQSKPEGVESIVALLARLEMSYGRLLRNRNTAHVCGRPLASSLPEHAFTLHADHARRVTELMPDKHKLPDWMRNLSTRQFGFFLQGVMAGDGHVREKESVIYGRESILSQIQALAVTHGIPARLRTDNRGHHILSLPVSQRGYINNFNEQVKTVHYEGVIWCGTVANGTLITRRNGCPLVSGNTTQKPRHATGAKHSYEWLLYRILEGRLAEDQQIEFQIADQYFNFMSVYGRNIRFHHGDALKYNGGVGDISIGVNKAIAAWNKSPNRADLDIFGHWHRYQQNSNWLCNGSLVGYNAFALSIKASFEPPLQTYFLLDKKRGRTMTAPIYL